MSIPHTAICFLPLMRTTIVNGGMQTTLSSVSCHRQGVSREHIIGETLLLAQSEKPDFIVGEPLVWLLAEDGSIFVETPVISEDAL